jgi:hypothetical protein
MPNRIEYACQLFNIPSDGIDDDQVNLLNRFGQEGWSLSQALRLDPELVLMIFQRPAEDEPGPSREV